MSGSTETPIPIPLVDLRARYAARRELWGARVADVLASGRYIGGPEVAHFEQVFSSYLGTKHGVGVASGTDALRLALMALGVGPGDEVATVSLTFAATADAILSVGASPVFVDIDPRTYTMDPEKLRSVLGPRVKAVIPVHLYGQPADLDPILELCREYDIDLVEDAAQAHGAVYRGRRVGSIGKVGCFSFYPSKNLGAVGDGGFVATDDASLAEKVQILRNCGQASKYDHVVVGMNSRLDAIQAAVLLCELPLLDAGNESRRRAAKSYSELLAEEAPWVDLPVSGGHTTHVFHIFPGLCQARDRLRERLSQNGVETGIHYPIPIHRQRSYSRVAFRASSLNETERVSRMEVSLPIYPEITESQISRVVQVIAEGGPDAHG